MACSHKPLMRDTLSLFDDTNIWLMIGAAALLGLAVAGFFLSNWFARSEEHRPNLEQYVGAAQSLNPVEADAAEYLRRALGPDVHICPQVAVQDIYAAYDLGKKPAWKKTYQALAEKRLDFLVIDTNLQIHFAILFDKRNAQNPNFDDEARTFNTFFKQAGVNLIHVLPRKLERSDHLEFAAKQTRARPVIRKVA